jgi:hypothetical protein
MVGEELAAMVLATAELNDKAHAKFGDGVWWCTRRSLSQATPYQVANLKARWIQSGRPVFDLCSGIGGDTIAIARSLDHRDSLVTAVDRDPIMAAMVSENLRLNMTGATSSYSVLCDEIQNLEIAANAMIHLDPDRRDEAGRKTRPEDYSPAWNLVERMVDRCDAAIIKLAPAAEIPDRMGRHRIWISLAGSVREQTLLMNQSVQLASLDLGVSLNDSGRSAIAVNRDGTVSIYSGDLLDNACERSDQPIGYMVDPDAAVRASGLTESFARQHGLKLLGGPAGFLTGENAIENDLAICEPVIWTGSCDDRRLRKKLRSMNCFPWRVKTRGVSQNPNELENRYRQCGEKPVTLWIGKGSKRQYAVMTECRAQCQ